MEGLLLVDKPEGMSSHDVVNRVRGLSNVRRVGHAGTLDPLATGLLLVSIGRVTRLNEYLVGHGKAYRATVRLGQTTDSYDAEGEITVERPYTSITAAVIEEVLPAFRGTIQQRPPIYSAIKKNGQPLYKLARKGIEVDVPMREVTISSIEMLDFTPPFLQLEIYCSSGTYIRSIAHDLGEALECGGHITQLRRTAVDRFQVADAVRLNDLTPETIVEYLLPPDTAVSAFPRLDLLVEQANDLLMGRFLERTDGYEIGTLARVFNADGLFIGIAVAADRLWRPKKIFHPL